jgi:hypothetical protein
MCNPPKSVLASFHKRLQKPVLLVAVVNTESKLVPMVFGAGAGD